MPLLHGTSGSLPTASEAIAAFGVSREAAYAVRRRLLDELPALVRRRGRPASPAPEGAPPAEIATPQGAVLDYLLAHPGAASQGEHRRRYSDGFRLFVLDLVQQHAPMALSDFADAIRVPLGTLKDWLAGGRDAIETGLDPPNAATVHERLTHSRMIEVFRAYEAWKGSFVDFCAHVQHHLRIPFSRALLADLLDAEGLRPRSRRPSRRDRDAEALRGAFETFAAGAQAIADGTAIAVRVGAERFTFNVELVVDAHTAAWTGFAVTPTEDAAALLTALDDAQDATGQPPIAVLVDNKPSNHTDEVQASLADHDTILLRSTVGRAQNKAHVEGAFGLFKSGCPELVLDPTDPPSLARQLVELAVTIFARVLNHKPRPERGDRSRVQQFEQDRPTEDERAAARAALQRRAEQQERAARRAAQALDPALRQHLDEAFADLNLDDPQARFRTAIARYPADAVAAGLAIFRTKRQRGTLPDGVDARYLLGIVRNLALQDEGFAFADALWQERFAMRERALNPLRREQDRLELEQQDGEALLVSLIDRAIATDRLLDRSFWLRAAADFLLEEPLGERRALFRLAARRIHAAFKLPHKQRLAATRRLAAMALPLLSEA